MGSSVDGEAMVMKSKGSVVEWWIGHGMTGDEKSSLKTGGIPNKASRRVTIDGDAAQPLDNRKEQ